MERGIDVRKQNVVETEPLLYIVQPKAMRAAAHMQETFMWTSRMQQEEEGSSSDERGGEEEPTEFFCQKTNSKRWRSTSGWPFWRSCPAICRR